MIDTVKLVLKMDQPLVASNIFQPSLRSMPLGYKGYFRAVANPSAATKKLGIYEPRMTYVQHPIGHRSKPCELTIELSLPKLIYRNNFDELVNADYPQVIQRLKQFLLSKGIFAFSHWIEDAEVRAIHYSKNIIFDDFTSCSSILQALSTVDISRTYDVQKTDFRNGGHVYHIHTNSLDIAFYDKLADLAKARTSEKRAIERDNYAQLSLFNDFKEQRPLAVLRYEVRLNSKKQITNELTTIKSTAQITLHDLFSTTIAQNVLKRHWKRFFQNLDLLQLDTDKPEHILANILKEPGQKRPLNILARIGMTFLLKNSDPRRIRRLLEDALGDHVWGRLKSLRSPPDKRNYRAMLHIDQSLEQFSPTKLADMKL